VNKPVEILDNDIEGIQSIGQAVAPVVEKAGQMLAERQNVADMTPMQMAYQLIQNGADLGSVKEMLAMSRELAAEHARRAFDTAIAEAKSEIPVVAKNAKGHNDKRYADFSAYAMALKPILAKHGLSYRFRTDQTDGKITVTCILSHRAGHSEENSLSGPSDTSGSKNAIQAVGSTLTYLQRYTLIQALGLAAGEDDDGKAAGGKDDRTINDSEIAMIRKDIADTQTDESSFLKWLDVDAIEDIKASALPRIGQSFDAKRRRLAS
jgi:hypothetical protein